MASYARRFILHNVRHRRRLLRHDARAHPPDQGGGARRWRRPRCASATPRRPRARPAPSPAASTAPPVPREQKSRLAARSWRAGAFVVGVELLPPRGFEAEPAIRARARAEALRRRRRQHPRRPARRRAAERAVAGGADRAAGRHRDAAALLLPRPQPARHPVRSARRARDGAAQPAAHHRRSRAASATIPDATAVFDVDSIGLTNVVSRLNHGCDVGGQAIGAPTGVSHRRVGEPGGVEPRRGAAAVRLQGRGRAPSSC